MSRFSTDLLRVIAVTYVVLNHATWNAFVELGTASEGAAAWCFAVLNQLGKPSVLLFLFLSGFAFGVHPAWGRNDGDRFGFSMRFYRNRALRILPPYILMSLIGFTILTIQSVVTAPESAAMFAGPDADWFAAAGILAFDFAAGLFDGRHMFHLYFVALLCYLYLLFPWIAARPAALPRPSRLAFSMALACLPIFAFYLLADPHNRHIQSLIPYATELAPLVQARLSGPTTTWLGLAAYALPFFIGGVRAGQWTALGRAQAQLNSDSAQLSSAKHPVQRRAALVALCVAAVTAFALVFGDFLFHVFQTGQYPDSAGRIWRPIVVVYAVLAVALMWTLTSQDFARDASHETAAGGATLRRLARLSFLVYLSHPLLQFAFSALPFAFRVPLILGLAWPLALGLSALAGRYRLAGFLLGEGDREFARPPAKPEAPVAEPVLAPAR
ncbi:MAG: acyltransferase [bacterium]|nr:acyltransferase [bacterium]